MSGIQKDDYIVCRYKGESGDVIAGQVVKIRAGKAYMKNLLTGTDSERAVDIVNRRNITVPRDVALSVAKIYHDTEDKQKARTAAVEAANEVKKEAAATAEKDEANGETSAEKAVPKRRGRPPGSKNKSTKEKEAKAAAKADKKAAKATAKNGINGVTIVNVTVQRHGKTILEKEYKLKE